MSGWIVGRQDALGHFYVWYVPDAEGINVSSFPRRFVPQHSHHVVPCRRAADPGVLEILQPVGFPSPQTDKRSMRGSVRCYDEDKRGPSDAGERRAVLCDEISSGTETYFVRIWFGHETFFFWGGGGIWSRILSKTAQIVVTGVAAWRSWFWRR